MKTKREIPERLFMEYGNEIELLLRQAAKRVVWEHKQLGLPISTMRDGQVVIIPPDEIEIDADENGLTLTYRDADKLNGLANTQRI